MVGAIEGQINLVFEKLSKLQIKNSFSFAIVIGDLFADPPIASVENEKTVLSLLAGEITVPLPTYFTVGKYTLPQQVVDRLKASNGELCQNLYFLGKRSTTKTSEGIRIVALGGSLDSNVTVGLSKDKYLPFYTEGDAKSLHGASSADILITNDWPLSIRTGSNITKPGQVEDPVAQQCVADICTTLKPRYHFSTSPTCFYEREPFFHQPTEDQSSAKSITRFLSLASFNNPNKQKWLYAFSLDPNAIQPPILPAGTTASPLTQTTKKRKHFDDHEQSYSRFPQHSNGYNRHSKRSRQPPPTPSECFFCLSNPNLATHLITSIATDTYLTTAKGPLTTRSSFPSLKCPSHILIIPLTHSPSLNSITDAATRSSTYKEMQRYRSALHTMLTEKSNGKLGAVTWEVSRAAGIHIHWQFLPTTTDLIEKGLVEAAFKVEAENEKYPLFKTKDIGDGSGEESDYFRVWIWTPQESERRDSMNKPAKDPIENGADTIGKEKSLILPLSPDFRFDLQFGRRVMAKLLGLESRLDWKDCMQEQAEETADAETFKTAFKKFDFSLEET